MRRQNLLFLISLLLIGWAVPSAQAEPSPFMAFGAITYHSNFPLGVIAGVQVTPTTQIIQARLHITLDGVITHSQEAIIPPHGPGETITLQTIWNGQTITRDPTPPWMPLQLWWSVTDSNGMVHGTHPQQHIYNAGGRAWVANQGAYVTVYTYGQASGFIQQAIQFGDDAVGRLQTAYGYALPYRPALVFYNAGADGDSDLRGGASAPFGAYVVGRAYPGTSGAIILARQDAAYMRRIISHELAHLYQYQLGLTLFNAPHWWIEGEAKAHEPPASLEYSLSYARNLASSGNLPNLTTWNTHNTRSEAELDRALMVGASFAIYLKEVFGAGAMAKFYANWRTGGDFHQAFQPTFGRSLEELNGAWRAWLLSSAQSTVIQELPNQYTVELQPIMLAPLPEGMARVNTRWLNFRTEPDVDAEALMLLTLGQLILPIGRNETEDWLLVELPDGTHGWVYHEFVDYDGSIPDLTVALYGEW